MIVKRDKMTLNPIYNQKLNITPLNLISTKIAINPYPVISILTNKPLIPKIIKMNWSWMNVFIK